MRRNDWQGINSVLLLRMMDSLNVFIVGYRNEGISKDISITFVFNKSYSFPFHTPKNYSIGLYSQITTVTNTYRNHITR